MFINENSYYTAPQPEYRFQQVQLQKGGIYKFNASYGGALQFVTGTTFPFGVKVDTHALFNCPTKITPGGGVIQLGDYNDGIWDGHTPEPNEDRIVVYGKDPSIGANDEGVGFYLWDYIESWSSDLRLKKNVKPIDNSIEKINQLSGNTFQWTKIAMPGMTKKPGDSDIGVIAQEVQKVLPDAVSEKNSYLQVSYNKLIPLLIEGVKELSNEVNSLKEQLKELGG